MIWRYPTGPGGKRIEQRSVHGTAPEWLPRVVYNGKERILLNNTASLVWVANLDALELHVPFDRYDRKDYPTELVFDLDPPDDRSFALVSETALALKEVLDSLGLFSVPKTSGATGLQIYIPIEPKYTFAETRKINKFIADYMSQKNAGSNHLGTGGGQTALKIIFRLFAALAGPNDGSPLLRARAHDANRFHSGHLGRSRQRLQTDRFYSIKCD